MSDATARAAWSPYKPVGYPIRDHFHNPWLPIDPISGATAYDVWVDMGKPTDNSLRAKLDEIKRRA